MKLIYVQTRLKGQGSYSPIGKEQQKIDNHQFVINSWFRYTILLMFLVLTDNLLEIMTVKVRNLESLPALRYLVFCNMYYYNVRAIPTYRVYQLHDYTD